MEDVAVRRGRCLRCVVLCCADVVMVVPQSARFVSSKAEQKLDTFSNICLDVNKSSSEYQRGERVFLFCFVFLLLCRWLLTLCLQDIGLVEARGVDADQHLLNCALQKAEKRAQHTQHTTHNTTHNTQHTAHSTHNTPHNTQHTTHSTQHTQHTTHTTHNTQHTAHTTDNTQHTQHTTHNSTQHTQHSTQHTAHTT